MSEENWHHWRMAYTSESGFFQYHPCGRRLSIPVVYINRYELRAVWKSWDAKCMSSEGHLDSDLVCSLASPNSLELISKFIPDWYATEGELWRSYFKFSDWPMEEAL